MNVLRALFGAVAFVLFATVGARAADVPIPPTPSRWVTDTAGFLSAQTVRTLDERLQAYEATTRRQVLVYVASTTGDTPLEQWTVNAFEAWRVGRQGLDDGVVLFVFSRDRTARIEVGYGMEEALPDATAARVIRLAVTPWFTAGDPDRGVTEGVSLILRQIGGESAGAAAGASGVGTVSTGNVQPLTIPQMIAFLFMGTVFLMIVIRNPWIALYMLVSIASGGRGGGYSGGGGSFSGGGGRSGGGGASGSW
jgi:uncharacterized protein